MDYTGLVSVEELVAYMGGSALTDTQAANAKQVLAATQEFLEMHLNRPLQPVQIRETVVPNCRGFIRLRVTPIHRIISITSVPGNVSATPFYVPSVFERDPDVERALDTSSVPGDYLITPGGVYVGNVEFSLVSTNSRYMVDYIGGYRGFSDNALKVAIMRVAAREVNVQFTDIPAYVDDMQEFKPSNPVGKGWTDEELKALSRLQRIEMR